MAETFPIKIQGEKTYVEVGKSYKVKHKPISDEVEEKTPILTTEGTIVGLSLNLYFLEVLDKDSGAKEKIPVTDILEIEKA